MNLDLKIKFHKLMKTMSNADNVIILNRLHGALIKISKECYDIL